MFNRILLLLLLICTGLIHAQSQMDIDSLLNVYQTQKLDTNKVRTLNQVVNYYMYRDRVKAKEFAMEELELAEQLDYTSGIALANYQIGIVYNNLDLIDSAKYHYNKSLDIARKIENSVYISQAYRGLAILEFSQGNLNQADSINNMDLAHTIKYNDSVGMALSYDFKGTINQNKGYYEIALENVLKGLELFRELDDEIRVADGLNHLATLELNLNRPEKGIEYNSEALAIYEAYEDIYYQAQVLNDLGVMYNVLGEHEKARNYFGQCIEKSKQAGSRAIEAAALTGIGTSYYNKEEANLAIDYYQRSISLSEELNAQRRIAIASNKLAKTYLLIDSPREAVQATEAAIAYGQANDNISILRTAYGHRSKGYEALGQSGLALADLKEYSQLNDSVINTEKAKRLEELKVVYETERREAALALQEEEIKTLNEKAKVDKLTKTLYGGGAVAGLVMSGLLFFGFRQRLKKNRIEREKQEEIFKQELAFKRKELASQTLHLVQKNTFLQELKDNLERLKNSPEKFKVEFRRIVMLLKKESSNDKDWEVFKSYFTEVHDNFDNKLKAINQDITEKDLRLATFIKMNLSTKEIAAILNVLPQSILTSKYRLKKKLGIDKDTDIYQFLTSLA